ncbi:malto-oligosyltrehalose synthase [Streptomyces gamaensis]|uniref:Malto-oligosyltrehalose synthase n=1 Tax=Streptomyces gamaensis TaxID=1763542 RepID=A0ABW0ZBQ7_9ACTN
MRSMDAHPTATYRLQLQPGFTFRDAERAVPYLASLGVSHLHLSPVLEAVPGSAHGYDVVDHSAVRAELGGEEGLRSLARTARAHGLGLVLDIVPNHMAVPALLHLNNPLWQLLRDGPASPYARWFDIDWSEHGGRVLLPVLAGPLGTELRHMSVAECTLRYRDRVLPLRPGTAHLPLPRLLDAQWYRPAWWRLARTELNYRRFFTVPELIAVRVEDPEVFAATHATVLRLLREGVADGLRVDHPDGLADPAGYLARLAREAPGRWTVVEKILTGDSAPAERLPAHWPVAGTTGYEALRHLDGLFTDPSGAAGLAELYRARTGRPPGLGGEWSATVRRAAREVVTHELAAETERLVRTAARLCDGEGTRERRDIAPWALRTALREILVRLPVYRPYALPGSPPSPGDAALLEEAARAARPAFTVPQEARAVDAVRDAALGRLGDGPEQRDFCARFAQTAATLRAKSVEDRAFYRFAPLLSATEVGGTPGQPAVTPEEFHAYCAHLQQHWPAGGTVLSTHDTKRSADVRARIAALTECPRAWAAFLDALPDGAAPDPHVAWAAWQLAFGLGEPDAERLVAAVLKGEREAALRTTWTEPDAAYERAVADFVRAGPGGPAYTALAPLEERLRPAVRATTLGAALLHLTMPGVPDLYMGTERTYRALVDPDNRRPPALPGPPPTGLAADKLRLTRTALRLRRARPGCFDATATYRPLTPDGPAAAHAVAFTRSGEVVTVATRLALRLTEAGGWHGTVLTLPDGGRWRELLTGRTVASRVTLADLLDRCPVALLVRA